MKILAVAKLYAHKNGSGGETYLHQFLQDIQADGHEVSVLLPEKEQIEITHYHGIKVFETDEEHWKDYLSDPDLVITQLDFSEIVINHCMKIKQRVVQIEHCHIARDNKHLLNPKVVNIFNAPNIKKLCNMECGGVEGKTFTILPACPDYSEYATENLRYRQFITMVNPSKQKGGDIIYKLAELMPHRKFMVVEGGYYPWAQDVRFNYPNVVIQPNTQDIVKDVYMKSRIVLQPSRWETYGMVSAEARSCGIPTIVSKASGLTDNHGVLALYGNTLGQDEEATHDNVQRYKQLIEMLDHQPSYLLWSQHALDTAERVRKIQKEQVQEFLDWLKEISNI
jgi:glycosyltransferase involved in cell wall biosynthesis